MHAMVSKSLQAQLGAGSIFAGKYLIEKKLGEGGFSKVFLATETRLERKVALKMLIPPPSKTAQDFQHLKERFFREAQILGRLRSPHTVRLYDYDDHAEQVLYMALEHIDGVDLKERLASEGRFSPQRALSVITQVLHGLREVHSLGILHRDLKPTNIMLFEHLEETDRVKLLDFGIAKSVTAPHSDLTREGSIVGTPRYLSPEQLLDYEISPASDIYAVGLLLYEMLLGHSPHPDEDLLAIHARMQKIHAYLRRANVLDPQMLHLLSNLLAYAREDRFSTIDEVLDAIEAMQAHRLAGPSAAYSPDPATMYEGIEISPTAEVEADASLSSSLSTGEEQTYDDIDFQRHERRRHALVIIVLGVMLGLAGWGVYFLEFSDAASSPAQPPPTGPATLTAAPPVPPTADHPSESAAPTERAIPPASNAVRRAIGAASLAGERAGEAQREKARARARVRDQRRRRQRIRKQKPKETPPTPESSPGQNLFKAVE